MHQNIESDGAWLAAKIKAHCLRMAQIDPSLLKDDGTPNHNRIANAIQETTGRPFTQSTLTRLLNGEVADPSKSTLRALADFFDRPVFEFVRDLSKDPEPATSESTAYRELSELDVNRAWSSYSVALKRQIVQTVHLARSHDIGSGSSAAAPAADLRRNRRERRRQTKHTERTS